MTKTSELYIKTTVLTHHGMGHILILHQGYLDYLDLLVLMLILKFQSLLMHYQLIFVQAGLFQVLEIIFYH